MTALSLRERRLVAVAILFALLAALLYGIILPVVDGFSDRAAARTELLERYARDERAVTQIASTRRAAEGQRGDAARYRLDGTNAALAADGLRTRIGTAVAAAGGELRSAEDVAAAPGFIRVRTDCRVTTGQLSALLAGLQRSAPLLTIETLTVTADQALQTGRAAPMDVRLEISAPYPAAAPR